MRSQANMGQRRTLLNAYPLIIKNESGQTIPPFSLLGVAGATGVPINESQVISVGMPAAGAQLVFNGPIAIKAGKKGRGTRSTPAVVLADSGSLGTVLGPNPITPSFSASPLGTGLKAWSDVDGGVCLVETNFTGTGDSTPPLRWFVLIVDKQPNTTTALVRFLDDNQAEFGDTLTIYDPPGTFSGRAGFRGQALLRRDMAEIEADRWEITNIESYIPLIIGRMRKTSNYPSPGDTWHADYIGNATDLRDWQNKQPVTIGSEVLLQAQPPTLVNFEENQTVLLSLIHSMSFGKPTYMAVAAIGGAGAVLVRTTTSVSARSGTTAGTGTVQPVAISGAALSDSGSTETAYNLATHTYATGMYLTAGRVSGQLVLNTWDAKSLAGFTSANDQSIGHDASDNPEWQDDATCTEGEA